MPSEFWLTPEQAAAESGRSMIAIRALIETTLERDGTKHLLQVFDSADSYETGYLLHRSLVTGAGLGQADPNDVVERLTARIEELEGQLEVERFRSASLTAKAEATPVPVPAPVPAPKPVSAPVAAARPAPPAPEQAGGPFWLVLGLIILITSVIILYILIRQGYLAVSLGKPA